MALTTNFSCNPYKITSRFPDSDLMRSSRKVSTAALSSHFSTKRDVRDFKEPIILKQVTQYSMAQEKHEIFNSLNEWVENNILVMLKDVEKSWQPCDYLPDSASEGFKDEVEELRDRMKDIPDECLVVLVGNMITEEALPTYHSLLTTADGIGDVNGDAWAMWIRGWSAEENRHGDLLNRYLYLSGRVDIKRIEKTIQYLIGSGADICTERNPYRGFIYTSFQERATFITHGNTARLAKQYGDTKLAQICGAVAADEKRHEAAYTKIVEKLFEIDPDTTIRCLADMMKKKIVMPAHMMYDGADENLFGNFSAVAQRIGVYTARDYTDILEFLVERWGVEKLRGLSDEGRKSQDYVCGLVPRYRKFEERTHARAKQAPAGVPFSWIFGREV